MHKQIIGIIAIFSDGVINLQGMSLTAAMITITVVFAVMMLLGYAYFWATKDQREDATSEVALASE